MQEDRLVYIFSWTEFERGWGARPDGHSIHASAQAGLDYVKSFYQRNRQGGYVPDEYEQPDRDEPTEVRAEELIARWVEQGDQRVWRGAVKVEGDRLVFADPRLRARIEAQMIEASAKAGEPGKSPRL